MTHEFRSPDLTDPDWLPTDAEELALLKSFAQRVAWEKAMAARGVRIHKLGLTPEQELAEIQAWASQNASAPVRAR